MPCFDIGASTKAIGSSLGRFTFAFGGSFITFRSLLALVLVDKHALVDGLVTCIALVDKQAFDLAFGVQTLIHLSYRCLMSFLYALPLLWMCMRLGLALIDVQLSPGIVLAICKHVLDFTLVLAS